MKPFLYKDPILPDGFKFPQSYEALAKSGRWPSIEPWRFLAADMPSSLSYYGALLLKFPQAPLIPFAMIGDPSGSYNDGYVVLACFDGSNRSGQPAVRIYDYGRPKISPWENIAYPSFDAWLSAAHEESARHKAQRADQEEDES